MKKSFISAFIMAALCHGILLRADVTLESPAYSYSTYHTHSESTSAITSFDRGSDGNLYYQASTANFTFGGIHSWNGTTQSTVISGNESLFSGGSVVSIDDYIYFNTSDFIDQRVSKYGPLGGAPLESLVGTPVNSGLYGRHAAEMFIAGAPGFGTNEIFYATLDSSGNFARAPFSLGITVGSSGPIAFDGAGNMYYAPGFQDLRIYKYTASDVAAAIADPMNKFLPAAAERLWYDYEDDFAVAGGTGMTFDENGNLLLTLTAFGDPSFLVRFDVDGDGAFGGFNTILSSTDRLGDVRFENGSILLTNGNTILQVVPEPGTLGLLAMSAAGLAPLRRRRTSFMTAERR